MKEIIQDIRIVSLYKQHYFDKYNTTMHTDYSCWGYYDGISIVQIDTTDDKSDKNISHLFEKRSKACISPVWCGTVHNAEDLNGTFSKQNIGIFRCYDVTGGITWEQNLKIEKTSPYFALAFLQLSSREQYSDLETKIKNMSTYVFDTFAPYVFFNTYHTYDNADLIILLYSNSLKEINNALASLENDNRVRYVHSIMGVSENYLSACVNRILPEWNNVNCYINEGISHMNMNLSTSGDMIIKEKVYKQFIQLSEKLEGGFKGLNNIAFFHSMGHSNLLISIPDTDTKSVLSTLVKKGILTHDNELFGKDIYNIETHLSWGHADCKRDQNTKGTETPEATAADDVNNKQPRWFSQLTTKYRSKMDSSWELQDEGGFSYYCALTQVCNILSQYEGFSLSTDIFLLLYPSFRMFDIQLEQAGKLIAENPPSSKTQTLNESICEFVNAVNSVVYHTIHTDQIFLMIPGYSGTTFSIPVKLCLIYMWVIRKVFKLLNDADYQYACLLTPELETRPATTVINMGLNSDDRLIRFSSSQRSLYMPRHFIILITHELAHYTGKNIRNRHLRIQSLSRILAYLLSEGIFPEEYKLIAQNGKNLVTQKLYCILEEEIKTKIQLNCVTAIYEKIQNDPDPRKEHATNALTSLKEICYELLGEKGIIYKCIYSIPDGIKQTFHGPEFIEAMEQLSDAQNRMDYNRRVLFASRTILDSCISELMQIFREVFSDVAAFIILEYDINTFTEVFNVSEGNVSNSENDIQRRVRKWIIRRLSGDTDEQLSRTSQDAADKIDLSNWPSKIKNNLFTYCWVGKYLWDYASASANAIKVQIKNNAPEKDKVKELYDLFTSDNASCSFIYDKIVTIIKEYADDITAEYKADLTS